ncbi:hypothetical protein ACC690_39510, partial [Rhizobium johnstonii]|uniref:hypothetical protein n=1 Tax=Rhizobium johnstonii TaxID=3019933 RepID=UPI003F967001
ARLMEDGIGGFIPLGAETTGLDAAGELQRLTAPLQRPPAIYRPGKLGPMAPIISPEQPKTVDQINFTPLHAP